MIVRTKLKLSEIDYHHPHDDDLYFERNTVRYIVITYNLVCRFVKAMVKARVVVSQNIIHDDP